MVTVSLCMIVKDEEDVLERCLESAAGLVDEIIIVDIGSTDRTREIAERLIKNHAGVRCEGAGREAVTPVDRGWVENNIDAYWYVLALTCPRDDSRLGDPARAEHMTPWEISQPPPAARDSPCRTRCTPGRRAAWG